MKIGFDAQSVHNKKTGIGYYTENLIRNLKKDNSIKLFCYKNEFELNVPQRIWWENIKVPNLIKKDRLDIFHATGFAGPYKLPWPCKKITTIHDLIGILFPENLGFFSRYYWSKWLARCARTSDFIITDSQNSKQDIIRLLNFPENKIKVVYLAADPVFKFIEDKNYCLGQIKNRFGIQQSFILTVGTIEPRKNLSTLIEAYNLLDEGIKKSYKLVFAGKKGWDFANIVSLVKKLKLEDNVIFLDYVRAEEMNLLYNCASVFVFPSIYEGFGLPVLEAFSCGTPVICSNSSSLREVAKYSALLFESLDVKKLKELIKQILTSQDLQRDLMNRGLEKSKEFSWKKTAYETQEVYKRICDES